MNGNELKSWRAKMGLSKRQAAILLGCHPDTYSRWETRRNEVPRYVALACSAIYLKIEPWPEPWKL